MEPINSLEGKTLSLRDRYSYFIECHSYAREELFFRLRERSRFFYIHLLVQVTILALAFGVQLGQFKPPGPPGTSFLPFSLVLILAVPSAFVFATLYTIEDYLVDIASRHLAQLSRVEQELAGDSLCIANFDRSVSKQFTHITIPLRFQAQLIAFTFIPATQAFFRFYTGAAVPLTRFQIAEATAYGLILLAILGRLICLYRFRRRPVDTDDSYISPHRIQAA